MKPQNPDQIKKREETEENIMKVDPKALEILLSKERTLLSYERTMISLAQLGFGIAALGFFIVRFFAVDPGYEGFLILGFGLIATSAWLFYHAFKDYRHFRKKLAHLREKRGHLDVIYIKELGLEDESIDDLERNGDKKRKPEDDAE